MYAIETEKLTKYYGNTRGVIDLNLQIEEGDIYGFIGPNGIFNMVITSLAF